MTVPQPPRRTVGAASCRAAAATRTAAAAGKVPSGTLGGCHMHARGGEGVGGYAPRCGRDAPGGRGEGGPRRRAASIGVWRGVGRRGGAGHTATLAERLPARKAVEAGESSTARSGTHSGTALFGRLLCDAGGPACNIVFHTGHRPRDALVVAPRCVPFVRVATGAAVARTFPCRHSRRPARAAVPSAPVPRGGQPGGERALAHHHDGTPGAQCSLVPPRMNPRRQIVPSYTMQAGSAMPTARTRWSVAWPSLRAPSIQISVSATRGDQHRLRGRRGGQAHPRGPTSAATLQSE